MKKFLTFGILSTVACFGLTSCGSSDDGELIDAATAREEAAKAIDEQNLEEEARKLMEEIENDL